MARAYHEETKYTKVKLKHATDANWGAQPAVFKDYDDAERTELSRDFSFDCMNVEVAIDRASYRGGFSGAALSLTDLGRLLYFTGGITEKAHAAEMPYLRAAPSAGALYPTEIYVVINNVPSLARGVYAYSVKDHAVYCIKEKDVTGDLARCVRDHEMITQAGIVLMVSSVFYRTQWKYKNRGYRYTLMDAGHVGANTELISTALGYGVQPVATFCDMAVHDLLECDGRKEAVLYMCAIGKLSDTEDATDKVQIRKLVSSGKTLLRRLAPGLSMSECVHAAGSLDSIEQVKAFPVNTQVFNCKVYPDKKPFSLPTSFTTETLPLPEAIKQRRSTRTFSTEIMLHNELARLLYYAYGAKSGDITRPVFASLEGVFGLEVYAIAHNVKDVPPGVYYYNGQSHALEEINRGDCRFYMGNACLGQVFVGASAATIVITIRFERMMPYGDRGYRAINLDAGRMGQHLYLEATAMGLGACGIAAFFDDDVNGILSIDGKNETVLYAMAVGKCV